MDRDVAEIVRLIEAVGFRVSRGTEAEARAEGADFVCTEDALPVPLTVEAQNMVDLASMVAHVIAFHMVRGNLDAYLASVGIEDAPSDWCH